MDRLARRIAEVRRDRYGEGGLLALVKTLAVPRRTWMDFERGMAMPAPVLLQFIDLTKVEPHWLLTGEGPKYQGFRP